jgi:acetylornithine deacetylase
MNLKQTLSDLIAINSVSAITNAPIIDPLEGICGALGFNTRRFSYLDDNGVDKINLVAIIGTEWSEVTEVELALVGHTDTVPFDPHWDEALALTERDDRLYARGSCDTKGFIAAALSAVERDNLRKLKRPLAMVFTCDEEIGLRGAKFLADLNALRPRYSIVGEPTSLQPIRAGKGYSLAEVVVRGREAHSAYPALGVSAVFRAARLLVRLEHIAIQLQQDQHDEFDPPFTTINVGLLRGGTAKNVIPGECRFTVEWRPIPSQPSDYVFNLIKAAIAEEQESDGDLDAEVKLERLDSGFQTAADSRIVSLLEQLTEKRAGTVAFGTEAAQMTVLGSQAVVLGPGDIREAHRTGEFVPINELEKCSDVLTRAILELCG